MQQGVQIRKQHVTSNNDIASVSTGLYTVMSRVHVNRSFAVAPKPSA